MTTDEKVDALQRDLNQVAKDVAAFTAAHPPTLELINTNISNLGGQIIAVGVKVDHVNERLDKLNGRVRRLELWRAGVVVGMLLLSSLMGWMANHVVTKLSSVYTFILEHKQEIENLDAGMKHPVKPERE